MKQIEINLDRKKRGYHVITNEILEVIDALQMPREGVLHIFIKHTSAAITINESADPDVRQDFESVFNHIVPEGLPFLKHTTEGSDDMPAHIKAAMIGNSVTIPITDGRLNLGTWQGIYICEFRNYASSRQLVLTILSA